MTPNEMDFLSTDTSSGETPTPAETETQGGYEPQINDAEIDAPRAPKVESDEPSAFDKLKARAEAAKTAREKAEASKQNVRVPPVDETPAAEGEETEGENANESEEGTGETETPAAEGAFKARDKFKVMILGEDGQNEIDVPDYLKPLMTTPEREKEVIDLLERAHGLEPMKQKKEKYRNERDQTRGELQGVRDQISDIRTTFQRRDIDGFLSKLAIPQEIMLQWALEKVTYSQLPPEQQLALDQQKENQRRAWQAEQQVKTYQDQMHEVGRQAKATLLESGLARPDVTSFAQAFDAKHGRAGAFREEVVAMGQQIFANSEGKIDPTPDQVISKVLERWKPFITTTPAPAAGSAAKPPQGAQTGPKVVTKPTAAGSVIPNFKGGGKSPLKVGPRSIDDLKRLAAAKRAGK